MIGQRFGRLTVLSESPKKGYVTCKCDCGNVCQVYKYSLTKSKNPTSSCGCRSREVARVTGGNNIRQNSARRLNMIAKYGTNLDIIANTKPSRRNKSGRKGVWHDEAHGVYQAYISFRHKKYHLGTFRNFNDAVAARQEAEDRIFAPFLAEIRAACNT